MRANSPYTTPPMLLYLLFQLLIWPNLLLWRYTQSHSLSHAGGSRVVFLTILRDMGFPGGKMVKNLPAMQETQIRSQRWEDPLENGMAYTSVFLPGEFHGQRSLGVYSPCGHKQSDVTEWLTLSHFFTFREIMSLSDVKWSNDLCSFPRQTIQIRVIQVYAPTSNAEEAEIERFYEDLENLLELISKKDVLFIIGDWNAKVGSQEIPSSV